MPGLSFLNEAVSIKAGKARKLEKTGSKEGTAISVHSHRYVNLDLFFPRRHRPFVQATYCADPFVTAITTKYKNVHKIKKKINVCAFHELIWSYQYLYENRKGKCHRGSLLIGKDKIGYTFSIWHVRCTCKSWLCCCCAKTTQSKS